MDKKLLFVIGPEDEGRTVARFLRRQGISHRVLVDLKREPDGLTIAGETAYTNRRLHAGEELHLFLREPETSDIVPQEGLHLPIVFENEDLFVVDKPAGMAVHPSPGNRENSVANALAAYCAAQGEELVFRAIGRLDKDTSGLLLVARNAIAAGILTDAAAEKAVQREYLAVCTGELPESGTIDAPIGRVDGSVVTREVRADGACAVTHYERLRYENGYSLAHVRLETGRTHQIRVHMAHIGHPLPGDFLYNPDYRVIRRHALHAFRLTVPLPFAEKTMVFESPLPDEMKKFWKNNG
ncbi:MAG: RluA family pseudouridine synthase [Butyricicoccus sp.]|nr:RluA family pseudouridine synthase [Butyricicoccus sp.]MBQ8585746.1 RluA family pseudouridine synthase [Butyricicoccus sp.]